MRPYGVEPLRCPNAEWLDEFRGDQAAIFGDPENQRHSPGAVEETRRRHAAAAALHATCDKAPECLRKRVGPCTLDDPVVLFAAKVGFEPELDFDPSVDIRGAYL